jgi:hypothetical protein
MSRNTAREIEATRRNCSLDTLGRVARALNERASNLLSEQQT